MIAIAASPLMQHVRAYRGCDDSASPDSTDEIEGVDLAHRDFVWTSAELETAQYCSRLDACRELLCSIARPNAITTPGRHLQWRFLQRCLSLDSVGVLRFRSEWVAKSVWVAAIVSVLGTGVGIFQRAFAERKYPYESPWLVQVYSPTNKTFVAEHPAVMIYSQSNESYWGYSETSLPLTCRRL